MTSIADDLQKVLDVAPKYSQKTTPAVERDAAIADCKTRLEQALIPFQEIPEIAALNLHVQTGGRQGSYAPVPWVRVYSPQHSPNATAGMYLVYLFAVDGSSAYLSLNQGTSDPSGREPLSNRPLLLALAAEARSSLGDLIEGQTAAKAKMSMDLAWASALVRRTQRIQNYEDANILAIEYESGHIPDEGVLLDDLGGMIPLLARLYGVVNHPAAASSVVSGTVTDPVSDVLEATARAEEEQDAAGSEDPKDDYDARLRVFRQIVARRGQPEFRAALLEAYQGRCAITGSDAAAALEAAHLRPYRGPDSNTVTNGLLLRADIHTLLDLCLLAPDPGTRKIVVSKQLAGTSYGSLSGHQLAEPAAPWQRPSQETLEIVWQHFREAEDVR